MRDTGVVWCGVVHVERSATVTGIFFNLSFSPEFAGGHQWTALTHATSVAALIDDSS